MSKRRRLWVAVAFLGPGVVLYVTFVLLPMAQAFYMSLFDWRGVSAMRTWVGLDNFRRLLMADGAFWNALSNNLVFTAVTTPAVLALALALAFIISRGTRRMRVYRLLYFVPTTMSVAAVAVLWSFVYNPVLGLLNGVLRSLGLAGYARAWLGDPQAALPALMVTEIWRSVGFYLVLFLAAMESIPQDLYDAAAVEGAGNWAIFWRIVLPLLAEAVKIGAVLLVINGLNVFVLPQIMTRGGPSRHTQTLAHYLYEQAFEFFNFGYATAVGVALFVLAFVASWLSLRLLRREVVQY